MTPTAATASPAGRDVCPAPATQRLMSLDALRGFDMFWIIGADSLVASLNGGAKGGILKMFADQLDHAEWEGFRFYDLIFPLDRKSTV